MIFVATALGSQSAPEILIIEIDQSNRKYWTGNEVRCNFTFFIKLKVFEIDFHLIFYL